MFVFGLYSFESSLMISFAAYISYLKFLNMLNVSEVYMRIIFKCLSSIGKDLPLFTDMLIFCKF